MATRIALYMVLWKILKLKTWNFSGALGNCPKASDERGPSFFVNEINDKFCQFNSVKINTKSNCLFAYKYYYSRTSRSGV